MKYMLALTSSVILGLSGQATVHVVTCQNGPDHFLPVTVYAGVGDTIHWTWVSGTHVVGVVNETDIPVGADSWNALIVEAYPTFDYVVAFPGEYHYVCHPDTPHGEDGYIVVSDATMIQGSARADGTRLYPNPFIDRLTVETTGSDGIILFNPLGERVWSAMFTGNRTTIRVDPGSLPEGVYFCGLLRHGVVQETLRVVKR